MSFPDFFSRFKKKQPPKPFDIVPPHHTIAGLVDLMADQQRVIDAAYRMAMFMATHQTCVGLAHSQFESETPLRFFVTQKEVVINPIVTRTSGYMVDSREGCFTYPNAAHITKKRFRKMDVTYHTFNDANEIVERSRTVTGLESFIFQHEIDHLDGKYCYDNEETLHS